MCVWGVSLFIVWRFRTNLAPSLATCFTHFSVLLRVQRNPEAVAGKTSEAGERHSIMLGQCPQFWVGCWDLFFRFAVISPDAQGCKPLVTQGWQQGTVERVDFGIIMVWVQILALPLTIWPWISCLTSLHLYNVDIILFMEMMPAKQLANHLACSGSSGISSYDVIMRTVLCSTWDKNPTLSFNWNKETESRGHMLSVSYLLIWSF